MKNAIVLLLLAGAAWGQPTIPSKPVHFVIMDPAGPCGNSYFTINVTTQAITTCKAGLWATFSGGGGGGATIAHTTSVLKGDNAGNGVAAGAGTDFQAPISGAPGTWPSFGGAALLNVGTTTGTVAAGDDSRFPLATMFPDAPAWQVCNPAGCGSETSNGYYGIMNPNGVTFDECGVNLAIAATGSAVHVDVQDSTGTSVFSAGYISIGTGVTSEVFNSSFVGGTYTAVKGAKFRAAVKQNDSGGTAQFAYVRCRVH